MAGNESPGARRFMPKSPHAQDPPPSIFTRESLGPGHLRAHKTSPGLFETRSIPGITAHRAVHVAGRRTVLVQGCAGAVGACAVQLAHQAGARVIATCRAESDKEIASQAGAAKMIPLCLHRVLSCAWSHGSNFNVVTEFAERACSASACQCLRSGRHRPARICGVEQGDVER